MKKSFKLWNLTNKTQEKEPEMLEITKQYPGHPDQGLANAAKIIGWISIGLTIVVVGLYLLIIIFAVAASAGTY